MADVMSRRRFLAWTGAASVAAAAAGWSIEALAARTRIDPLTPGTGVLVMLTMYGGNDGLNTVIPAGDGVYQSARPELAYAESEVLPLGDGLGLNPGMPGLKLLWDDDRLAIVRGLSYPKPDHSHFRSMDIWQTASPDRPVSSGWLGRWLDGHGHDPLLAVSLDPVLPPMLAGETVAGAALPASGLTLPGGDLGRAFAALGGTDPGQSGPAAVAARAVADLHRTSATIGPMLTGTGTGTGTGTASGTDPDAGSSTEPDTGSGADPDGDRPARSTPVKLGRGGKGGGGGTPLAQQLATVAECVEMGAPTRAYSVSLGGFDTHTGERATQQRLLTEVDGAVSAFLNRMAGSARGRGVVLVAYSEFGRRVAANANQGTDHGTAGPVLVAGHSVRGGFVGEQPSLTDLDNGDLKASGDFRDVYATMLADVLDTDPERILGPGRKVLPLVA
jgi:uncharacterized protein (DUF1501 family)